MAENSYVIGQRLILKLKKQGTVIGNLYSYDERKSLIYLDDVEDFTTKKKFNELQSFRISNIEDITVYKENNILTNDIENLKISENQNAQQTISENEWETINKALQKIIIIHQCDSSYFHAIKNLNNEKEISVLMEECPFGRNNKSTIITIYAPLSQLVYIFDIISLQELPKELNLLFESKKICKIMYESSGLCDHLKYCLKVENINQIFDVLVAYIIGFKTETRLELIDCVQKLFSLPPNYFDVKTKYNWHVRPLEKANQIFTAQKAIFLYKLHDFILHKHLLKPFYQICETFSKTFSDNEDLVEVAGLMSNNDNTVDKQILNTKIDIMHDIKNVIPKKLFQS